MTQIFILLILVLLFAILYGYYNFSNNITNILMIKEGIDIPEIPQQQLNYNASMPIFKTKNYSMATEGGFHDFITDTYSILSNGQSQIQDISGMQILSPKQININGMRFISNYYYILNGIDQQTFTNLSKSYPNMIETSYDMQQINKMYYSSSLINLNISKLTDTSISNDPILYNSLLGFLNTFYDSIDYFNRKKFPAIPITLEQTNGDDYNTDIY